VVGLEYTVLRVPFDAISIISNGHDHVEFLRIRVVNDFVYLYDVGVVQFLHDLNLPVHFVKGSSEGQPASATALTTLAAC
jgi:hypothetical protein